MTPLIFSHFGFFTLGTLGYIDLIAATTNAFNGALLARKPDHYKHFTIIGVIILAYAGGIGGGVIRDVLVNKVPSPLINPWYLIACLLAACVALVVEFNIGQRFKDGLFAFMTAFSLPWYAVVGAQTAVDAHLGYVAAVIIGVIGTTGGRWIIDVACGLVPHQLVQSRFFVVTAALTAILYLVMRETMGQSVIVSTIIAFIFGFGFRLIAQALNWEQWEPWEPASLKGDEQRPQTLGESLRSEFHP